MGNNYQRVAIVLFIVIISIVGVRVTHIKKPEQINCKNCNVIVVGYDTVGAKHVSSLGYERQTTPELDSLAKQGISFSQDYAPAPWTVPSFMSLFTSLYPTQHKVVNKYTTYTADTQVISNLQKLSPGTETLAQQFKKQGYITGAFTGDSGVSAKFGYGQGFDVYYDQTAFGSIADSSTEALSWLKQNPNKKFFMFLHGYDAHGQAKLADPKNGEFVPKDYTGSLQGTPQEEAALREKQLSQPLNLSKADVDFLNGIYDTKIKDGDARFAHFMTEFKKTSFAKNTVIVLVADHGEEWNEHSGVDHGHTLYNELVHVPLVIYVPGVKPHAQINTQISSLDVAPTILDITGITASDSYKKQMQGTSLVPVIQSINAPNQTVFLETDYLDYTHIRGVINPDRWKYIITEQTGKEELYNLNSDKSEKHNVINNASNKAIAASLRLQVRNHLKAMGDNPNKQWTTGCLPVYPSECKQ